MKLRKANNYKAPNYPTKKDFLLKPNTLKNYLPRKWSNNKLIIGAFAIFTLINKVEANSESKDSHISINREESKFNKELNNLKKEKTNNRLQLVAPLFIHGDGRGATGCVVINPPTFLSEEEARLIIEEELMNENIIFDKKNYKIDEAVFLNKSSYREDEPDTVKLDGFSSKYNLGYEFISSKDYFKFGGEWDGSSVQSYDVVRAAENLREKMKVNGKINSVIFYDPMERDEDEKNDRKGYQEKLRYQKYNFEEYSDNDKILIRKERKSKSIELLKKQISDFIEWAKKEELLTNK